MILPSDAHPCVTVALSGGLGNQLFQYAAARSLALRQGAELQLDASFYARKRKRHRQFDLQQFPIQATVTGLGESRWVGVLKRFAGVLQGRQNHFQEPHFHFAADFDQLKAPVSLNGYFQSPKYFSQHADRIRSELQPPVPHDSESLELARVLSTPDSVSVHVRRGDYVSNAKTKATFHECSPTYYQNALQQLPGRGPVVVFSDDIDWARANLKQDSNRQFVFGASSRTALADLWLMSKAHHHVIANSSFSWWGAWLSQRQNGMTIAPQNWFRISTINTQDLLPLSWVKVNDADGTPEDVQYNTESTRRAA